MFFFKVKIKNIFVVSLAIIITLPWYKIGYWDIALLKYITRTDKNSVIIAKKK